MKDAHDILLRVPPQNLEAEQSVLGAIFLDSEVALGYAMEILTTDDFYRESHRTIFRAMIKLYEMKTPIDAITIDDRTPWQRSARGDRWTCLYRGAGGNRAHRCECPVLRADCTRHVGAPQAGVGRD